jgi:hypothetical protein
MKCSATASADMLCTGINNCAYCCK